METIGPMLGPEEWEQRLVPGETAARLPRV